MIPGTRRSTVTARWMRVATACLAPLAVCGTVSAAPFVYVSEFQNASVAVIDTATNSVVAAIPVGGYPGGIVVNQAGTAAYVALGGSGSVAFLDLVHNTVTHTVTAGEVATDVALDTSGTICTCCTARRTP
ncbi:MAG: hypothetical protein WBW61_06550 [Rhodanobacteraceae bacterium]